MKRCDVILTANEYNNNPKQLSPLTLAFLGDAVFELLVRERFIADGNAPVAKLHKKTVAVVCASAQSNAISLLEELLSEEENDIYRRGRNANGHHVPKNADPIEYRRATGLEALFGYLYLKGEQERIRFLFDRIWEQLGQPSESDKV